jgi:hypothetical protein
MTRTTSLDGYAGRRMLIGDLHNHCGISYGHGSIEDAFANAKLQLDFATVTGHAWWHDMPRDRPEMADTVAYHQAGFERLAAGWEHVQDVTAAAHQDGEFVSFLSFEWHSSRHGDHCVYYRDDHGPLLHSDTLDELRDELRKIAANGTPTMMLPHHLGYAQGYRGANWSTFTPEFTPVVEIMSMHGCGESDEGPRPYLHSMGPRCADGTAVSGLSHGHRFGFIGSTDHHSAHPGTFGHGRAAVWADEFTRDGIWDAIDARRTYALTGDPIVVGFTVNEAVMGEAAAPAASRRIRADVAGVAPLDGLEIVRNGRVIHHVRPDRPTAGGGEYSVGISLGWGRPGAEVDWDVRLRVESGRLVDVTPRLRGEDILAPVADAPEVYHFSSWGRDADSAWLRTTTHGNPTVSTDATQGFALRVAGDDATRIVGTVNDRAVDYRLGELRRGAVTGYLKDVISPAWRVDRAATDAELTAEIDITDESAGDDWYYLRVRQTNDQWAWTSPVWVDAPR